MNIRFFILSLIFIATLSIYLPGQDRSLYEKNQNNMQRKELQSSRNYTNSQNYYNPNYRNNHRYDYSNPQDYYFNRQTQFSRIPD